MFQKARSEEPLQVPLVGTLSDVPAKDWDACAGNSSTSYPRESDEEAPVCVEKSTVNLAGNPFVSHAFLSALERSNSATARTGWAAQHLLVETAKGEILGAAPCY